MARASKEGKDFALCVVVAKEGSAPREVGAKMLVLGDGSTIGTLGGGPFERLAVQQATNSLREGRSRVVKFSFGDEVRGEGSIETGLICGGELSVLIDVNRPSPRLVIVGAGNVGLPLAKLAAMLGFRVCVVDENPEVASRERFPMVEEVVVDQFDQALARADVRERDFVAIVYGEVERDFEALKKMLSMGPMYVGLLGSRRKVTEFLKRLKEQGIDESELKGKIYAPIGLDMGAETPEEVALSIMAEIIAVMRRARGGHLSIVQHWEE